MTQCQAEPPFQAVCQGPCICDANNEDSGDESPEATEDTCISCHGVFPVVGGSTTCVICKEFNHLTASKDDDTVALKAAQKTRLGSFVGVCLDFGAGFSDAAEDGALHRVFKVSSRLSRLSREVRDKAMDKWCALSAAKRSARVAEYRVETPNTKTRLLDRDEAFEHWREGSSVASGGVCVGCDGVFNKTSGFNMCAVCSEFNSLTTTGDHDTMEFKDAQEAELDSFVADPLYFIEHSEGESLRRIVKVANRLNSLASMVCAEAEQRKRERNESAELRRVVRAVNRHAVVGAISDPDIELMDEVSRVIAAAPYL